VYVNLVVVYLSRLVSVLDLFLRYTLRRIPGEVWVDAVGYWKFITGTDRRSAVLKLVACF
jgi:hypothetical protein